MKIGTRVKVKSTVGGSDHYYAGRTGIVVEFDPTLPWTSPRALLKPKDFICVHFFPVTAMDRRDGSPMALLHPNNLIVIETKGEPT